MQGSPVSFEFEDVSPVEKRLKVEVAKEVVNAKLEEGFRQLNRQVNLKGFRKGHAPKSLLESMFGKRVGTDTARELVQESLQVVVSQNPVRMASEPMLETMPEAQRNQPLRYTARIELFPQIELKDYEGIAVTRRAGKVADTAVDEALERRRQGQTELVPVEGRDTAANTDVVTILLTGKLASLTYKDKEMQVDLTRPEQSPLPGLSAALVGIPLAAKDHPISLTMPTENLPDEIKGKTGDFKVTVKAAHEKRLPALDVLDRAEHRLLLAGFPLLTLGIVSGTVWATRLRTHGMLAVTDMIRDSLGYLTWFMFAAVLLSRAVLGWRGRKAAWGTLLGFSGAIAVLVMYLLRPGVTAP